MLLHHIPWCLPYPSPNTNLVNIKMKPLDNSDFVLIHSYQVQNKNCYTG